MSFGSGGRSGGGGASGSYDLLVPEPSNVPGALVLPEVTVDGKTYTFAFLVAPKSYAMSQTYGPPVPLLVAELEAEGQLGGFWSDAWDDVKKVAEGAVAPVTFLVEASANIVNGVRIDQAFGRAAEDQWKAIGDSLHFLKGIAPYVQLGISFIPGIGTGISAAIGAGIALASGKGITEALIEGVKGSLPGGPLVADAFTMALTAAADMAQGKSFEASVLDGIRTQVPGGELGLAAFDTAAALAQGKSLQQAGMAGTADLIPDSDLARATFNITQLALRGQGPAALPPPDPAVAAFQALQAKAAFMANQAKLAAIGAQQQAVYNTVAEWKAACPKNGGKLAIGPDGWWRCTFPDGTFVNTLGATLKPPVWNPKDKAKWDAGAKDRMLAQIKANRGSFKHMIAPPKLTSKTLHMVSMQTLSPVDRVRLKELAPPVNVGVPLNPAVLAAAGLARR